MNSLVNNEIKLSDNAQKIYDLMIKQENGKIPMFNEKELKELTNYNDLKLLMELIQELLNQNLIKLIKINNELKFQAIKISDALKTKTMSSEESLVYSLIESSAREGIWSKTIKTRTNLHQHVVLKCLKQLESQKYIKSVKSVKHPTRKIYMLYNLQPSLEITGGPWFTDGELDTEFIDSLLTIIWRFIAEQSVPYKNTNQTTDTINSNRFSDAASLTYAHTVQSHVTASEIATFIKSAGVSTVELSVENVRNLCAVLVYDDRLNEVEPACYKVTWSSVSALTNNNSNNNNNTNIETSSSLQSPHDRVLGGYSVLDINTSNNFPPSKSDAEAVFLDEWAL